ncbi:MAG: hypothetical protein IT167_31405 [Bryobacterales bacterium]|nr:hypothetical protein [Bryobacterales bacterium]
MTSRTSCWMLAAALAVLSPACHRKHPRTPPPPAPVVLPPSEPPKEVPSLPSAPKIQTPPPEEPPVNVKVEAPPPPVPQKKRRTRSSKKAESKVSETPVVENATPASPPPATVPRLGQILTPEESKDYSRRLETALDHVKSALVIIQGKTLNRQDKETADRIRSFVTQAEQARDQDLVSAVSLAERADLLSRDLLDRLR